MTSISARSGLVLVALLACLAGSRPALAQGSPREPTSEDMAQARDALRDGVALREKGELPAAADKLKIAYNLVPTPITAFELGKVYEGLGRLLDARELFLSVKRIPRHFEETERSAAARDESARRADALTPRIPSLRVKLKLPPNASAVVRIDGDLVPAEALATPRKVNPGVHVVEAKAGDGPPTKTEVTVPESETREIELAPVWVAPKLQIGPGGKFVTLRYTSPLVYVGFGSAAVGAVVGGALLYVGATGAGRALDRCTTDPQDESRAFCPQDARDDLNSASVASVAGLIALGFAAGGAIMGVIGVANPRFERVQVGIAPGVRARPVVGAGSVGLSGEF